MAISGGSGPFDFGRLKEFLTEFGFSKREASVYVALLKNGESAPGELNLATGFDRADVYRVLNKLLRRGFVIKVLDRPARFALSSPKKAFLRDLEARSARISLFKGQVEDLDELHSFFSKRTEGISGEVSRFELLGGEKHIFERAVEMLSDANCKKEICYFATSSCGKRIFSGLFNQFKLAFGRKVDIKVLLPIGKGNLNQAKALSKFADVRHVASSSSRIMIVDRKASMLFYSSDDFDGNIKVDGIGLWTNDKAFSNTQGLMFDTQWQFALDLNYRMRDLHSYSRVNESEFNNLADEGATSAVFLVNAKGKITHVSKNISQFTGFNVEHYLHKDYLEKSKEHVHPEDWQKISNRAMKVFSGNTIEEELRILHKNGNEVWTSISVLPLLSEKGKVQNFRVFLRNITSKKREEEAAKALLENEKKYRDLVENIQIGIAVIDEHNNVTLVNSRLTDLLGYSKDEMLGKPVFSFMDKNGIEVTKRYLRAPQKKGDRDFVFLHKDGSELFFRVRPTPILDLEGNYKGVQAALLAVNR